MKHVFTALVGMMLTIWLLFALKEFRLATKDRGWWRLLRLAATTLLALGALGFFGTAFFAFGSFNQLPRSFEWPIGYASGVVSIADHFIVPHTPSGRVQVYDRNWQFLHGWGVDAGAGTFKLHITPTNRIHVITARRQMHYTYDLHGTLLASETYADHGQSYSSFPSEGGAYLVPTRLWLWTFTSPIYSWLVLAIGFGLFAIQDKLQPKRKKK
jgi:hypothetical protein